MIIKWIGYINMNNQIYSHYCFLDCFHSCFPVCCSGLIPAANSLVAVVLKIMHTNTVYRHVYINIEQRHSVKNSNVFYIPWLSQHQWYTLTLHQICPSPLQYLANAIKICVARHNIPVKKHLTTLIKIYDHVTKQIKYHKLSSSVVRKKFLNLCTFLRLVTYHWRRPLYTDQNIWYDTTP